MVRHLNKFFYLFVFTLLVGSFQNCSRLQSVSMNSSEFIGSVFLERNSEETVVLALPAAMPVENGLNMVLVSDSGLVKPDGTVTSVNNELILVWRADQKFSKCKIANIDVDLEGGPQVFSNLESGKSYSFSCKTKDDIATNFNFIFKKVSSKKSTLLTASNVDVFLVAGQSNAVGQSIQNQSLLPVLNSNYVRYENDQLQEMNSLGAWKTFAQNYFQLTGRRVVIVSSQKGGSGSNVKSGRYGHWGHNGDLFQLSIDKVNAALGYLKKQGLTVQFKGVLWVQGESDAIAINNGDQSADDYKNATIDIFKRFRQNFGPETLIVLSLTGNGLGESLVGYDAVRKVQREIDKEEANTIVGYTAAQTFLDRGLMWDTYHYLPQGYIEMGAHMATAAAKFKPTKSLVAPVFNLYTGTNYSVLANNSNVFVNDNFLLKVTGLAELGLDRYYFKVFYNQDTQGITKGPFTTDIKDSLSNLGFGVGFYNFQIKGCNISGVCSDWGQSSYINIIMPSPQPDPVICDFQIVSGKTSLTLSDSASLKVQAGAGYVSVGQRNKIFGETGELISENPVYDWGVLASTLNYTSVDFIKSLTPLLIKNANIRVEYELMQKSSLSIWSSCNKKMSISWVRPSSSINCKIPSGYETSCGGSGVSVFEGGACLVQRSTLQAEVGLYFKCNKLGQWEVLN